MTTFFTALRAEHIKKRGTGLYVISVIFGLSLPVFRMVYRVFSYEMTWRTIYTENFYVYHIQELMNPFCGFIFPLLIIIVISRITQLDHRNGGWNLMETQPLDRSSIYFSKFTIVLTCIALSIVAFLSGNCLMAGLYSVLKKVPGSTDMVLPVLYLLKIASRLFMASLFIATLQYVLSVIIPGFIWSIVIGIGGLLLQLFLTVSRINVDWYPYQILLRITEFKNGSDLGYWFVYTEYVSFLFAILLLYTGFRYYDKRTFKWAFLTPGRSTFQYAAVAVILVLALGYTLSVNRMKPYITTVVAGVVENKFKFKVAYLVNMALKDTVAVIPIRNNRFHHVIKQPIVADYYTLVLDRGFQVAVPLFIGAKDSVFIKSKIDGEASSKVITGTRLAENQFVNTTAGSGYMDMYVDEYVHDPVLFTRLLLTELDRSTKNIGHFKTVDNYTPRADFNIRINKMVYVNYLNYWSRYLKKRTALFPGEKTLKPARIATLEKEVSLRDEGMLSYTDYFDYVIARLSATITADISAERKAMDAITRLPAGSFKDKMLYTQLNKSLEEASNSLERKQLMVTYFPALSSPKFRSATSANFALVESLGKGNPAPSFDAVNLKKEKVALSDFRGKYVVIDVWATWCGPCNYQSPYFEKIALKYKNKNVRFISLSTDEKIADWYPEALSKSPSVLQLHLDNLFGFAKNYNLQTIPRFILIDPDGKFVNSGLPFPNDQAFELLLQDVLKPRAEEAD